ncbi:MAG: glycosyltransferase family 2 protein [Desulfovibrio sp.]|nr:glycosyltransferase family 2 protein [Desulfovibrio sp.]
MRMIRSNGLISVIIPVWNGSAYLREAIASVRAQDVGTEIIVVDDGSTDGSREAAAALGCTPVVVPHAGIAKACNIGLRRATGDYLMMLDQDDVLCPGSLGKLLGAFAQDGSLHAAAAKAQDFISPDLDGEARDSLLPRAEPYHGLMTGALLLQRDAREIVGDFNESFQAGQAVDYLLRIERSGINYKQLDFVSVMRRLHAKNTGRTMKDKRFGDYGAILRARLAGTVNNG